MCIRDRLISQYDIETQEELDRFIQAMEHIHAEIMAVINGGADKEDNVLKNAPHIFRFKNKVISMLFLKLDKE